jgi:hypothetical protein
LLKLFRIAATTILLTSGMYGVSAAQDSGLGDELGIGSCMAGMGGPDCGSTPQPGRARDSFQPQQMPTGHALNQTASTTMRSGQSTVANRLE